MTPADAETSGTGGGLRYLTEEACPDVVAQEQSHSCQVACARQLLIDAGVTMTETELAERIGVVEGWGSTANSTALGLTELHPELDYNGGVVMEQFHSVLFRRDPWIATLRTDGGRFHAVIVDKLDGDIVFLRDPWGPLGLGSDCGSKATIRLSEFMAHWDAANNHAAFPFRRKQRS